MTQLSYPQTIHDRYDAHNVSTDSVKIHALIVAAGKGSRFGADIPKQYVTLFDRTLLEHSVGRLSASRYIHHCLVVIAADDDRASALNFPIPVDFVVGGDERWQSVQAGVQALLNDGGQADDLVVIHDAARPAVPIADIDAVVEAAKLEPFGAILATPVSDTLKAQVKPEGSQKIYISRTVSRQGIWQAQTPQVFRLGALQQVLANVAAKSLTITDEASAFEALSYEVRLILGSRKNIKLTYPDDLALLEAILSIT